MHQQLGESLQDILQTSPLLNNFLASAITQ
jgi:hypothetical protein